MITKPAWLLYLSFVYLELEERGTREKIIYFPSTEEKGGDWRKTRGPFLQSQETIRAHFG